MVFVSEMLGHLAARSAEVGTGLAKRSVNGGDGNKPIEIPIGGIILFWITSIAFVLVLLSADYTIKEVVGRLTMIETPGSPMSVPLSSATNENSEDSAAPDTKTGLLGESGEITFIPPKPITSKIRTTIKQIVSQGGFWARWRGFVPAIVYSLIVALVAQPLKMVTPAFVIPLRDTIVAIMVSVGLSNFHMVWTHAVISQPSPLRWYQRLAGKKAFRALMLPSAVRASAASATFYLTMVVGRLLMHLGRKIGHRYEHASKSGEPQSIPGALVAYYFASLLATMLFAVVLTCYLYLPAVVTHTRVEASLLPEDQETIVPFDRSFGGRVVPAIVGGSGAIGFVDAWKTFNWEARRRILKLYAKYFLIVTALCVSWTLLMGLEFWAVVGNHQLCRIAKMLREGNMVATHTS